MKPRRAKCLDRQWTAWNDRLDTEERHSRWFWPLFALWSVSIGFAGYAFYFYFWPWIMSFR